MGFYREGLSISMLSIDRIKELLDDESMSAAEAEDLRDACRAMAEIVYQKWHEEQGATQDTSNHKDHDKD
jgi:hypothetical protein